MIGMTVMYFIGAAASYVACSYLYQPMKNFEDGYNAAKKYYGDFDRGYDMGYEMAKKTFQDWDEGFGAGFESGWNAALEQEEEQANDA